MPEFNESAYIITIALLVFAMIISYELQIRRLHNELDAQDRKLLDLSMDLHLYRTGLLTIERELETALADEDQSISIGNEDRRP